MTPTFLNVRTEGDDHHCLTCDQTWTGPPAPAEHWATCPGAPKDRA